MKIELTYNGQLLKCEQWFYRVNSGRWLACGNHYGFRPSSDSLHDLKQAVVSIVDAHGGMISPSEVTVAGLSAAYDSDPGVPSRTVVKRP